MKKIKAIIFDFDGTLVESMDIKGKAFAHLFRNYPEKVEEIVALHVSHGGMSRFEKFEIIYNDILHRPFSEEKKVELGRQFSDYVCRQVLSCPSVKGADIFLEKYHNKLSFFIASGVPDEEIKSIIRDRGMGRYFRGVYGSPSKKKDIILKILQDFKFQRQDVIFVGDSIDDEEGAKGAKVRFILRTKENNPFQELEKIIS